LRNTRENSETDSIVWMREERERMIVNVQLISSAEFLRRFFVKNFRAEMMCRTDLLTREVFSEFQCLYEKQTINILGFIQKNIPCN